MADLPDVPPDPEGKPQDYQHGFRSLEGIERTHILEINGPRRHSIRRHVPFSLPDHCTFGSRDIGHGSIVSFSILEIEAYKFDFPRHPQEVCAIEDFRYDERRDEAERDHDAGAR